MFRGSWSDTISSLKGTSGVAGLVGPQGVAGMAGATEYTWSVNIAAATSGVGYVTGATTLPAGSTITYASSSLSIGSCNDGTTAAVVLETAPYIGWFMGWTTPGGPPSYTAPLTITQSSKLMLDTSCGNASILAVTGSLPSW